MLLRKGLTVKRFYPLFAVLLLAAGLYGCAPTSKTETQVPVIYVTATPGPVNTPGAQATAAPAAQATPATGSTPQAPETQATPGANPTVMIPLPTGSASMPSGKKPIIGMMGAYLEDFDLLKGWGVNTVHYYKNPGDTNSVSSIFAAAKKDGLNLMMSVAKINQFNDSFDLASVTQDPNKYFPDHQTVAADPSFLGYWVVDEPCNPKKKSPVQAQDFVDLYNTIKGIDPNIGIVINFGDLSCLQGFMQQSQPGWKLVDIAMFTITEKKLMQQPDYIAQQAQIADSIKAFDPNIKILPQIAVLEFKQKGAAMTPAAWAQSTGLEAAKYLNSFDGILYYSFHSYENVNFIGESISDVKNSPDYINAFKAVFSAAGQK